MMLAPNSKLIVNDVTQLNPVAVSAIARPESIAEVQMALKQWSGPVSVGGGHFSMGGQTASPDSLHLDMRKLNKVISFSPTEKTLRVQAGIRWCDIQAFIDPHRLSVKIMQTYANFTVGGSLSVNVHGRYIGLGPLVLSVRAICLVLANGEIVSASPQENSEYFYASIGGYGALGVIVEAELELADNIRVERIAKKMPAADYHAYFRRAVRDTGEAIFHNADLYAPHYNSVRAVSWIKTSKPVTQAQRLQTAFRRYSLEQYFLWAVSETPFGKWRREFLIDPFLYLAKPVHWRNYEAGYDVAELEPPSRTNRTYVLQEYFVPVAAFMDFTQKMREIFQRHRANVLNVSVRHAFSDPGTLLAWARGETFAFVVYYKQRTRENARHRVAVWTRELIDAAIAYGGTYYLPYQPHATHEQFHAAYPRAKELFALKRRVDPDFRFRNVLWDKYYAPTLQPEVSPAMSNSDFHIVYDEVRSSDAFYKFLQNIFHLFPEDRFHTLIKEAVQQHKDDESIYRYLQHKLPGIKPFLADLFYALPALKKQKQEMARQTAELLGAGRSIDGYVEIGGTGRYINALRKTFDMRGPLVLINDVAPTNSPPDVVERGQLSKLGRFVPMNDYAAISEADIPSNSVDLVSCYIGLHHAVPEKLEPFMRSIVRILRPGGTFILRDHDVKDPAMFAFVGLAHTVFNAGLGAPWEINAAELRYFVSVDEWVKRMAAWGLVDSGKRLLQDHDPTINVLLAFKKP